MGRISADELRAVEDDAIREIVGFQEALGFKGITDGEFRRTSFHTDFLFKLDGIEAQGQIEVSFQHVAGKAVNTAPPKIVVTGKIRHAKPIQRADYEYLASVVSETPKVTIPSPTMLHFRGRQGRDQRGCLSGHGGILRRCGDRVSGGDR